ncbi:DUF6351 family protein [Fibrivirga algicola]|uniref:Prolyl oligopeptidase family serine peptidase n=1 Tax=Fibrivirga algicola TaxID=2950420 RepID=A0ABX0QMN8_9BACT|nr:DUF6351 family protein [Fibrivirga algicola]NID12137.1 prolyl oligopeptidase family serine peptidase [Fibrivirga algicola]
MKKTFIRQTYYWLLPALLGLLTGCSNELDSLTTRSESNTDVVHEVRQAKTVTLLDGTLSAFGCTVQTLKTGEIYQICKPANWNGDLIMYAHGYVSPYEPLAISTEADAIAPLLISQGYAFATTSYSVNGLAVQPGITDIVNLRKSFVKQYGRPGHVYLTGGSEGGLITTLAIERYPDLFDGGLALCGPCGDFQRQINRYVDFRVLFDYYFPGVLPGTAVAIPDQLMQNWQSVYVPLILGAMQANPVNTQKLLATADLIYAAESPATSAQAVLGLLWYDVFATRNATQVLKGQPADNTTSVYINPFGSPAENQQLNQQVQRFAGDKQAMKIIEKDYQTSAALRIPLVQMHTSGDFLVPFWHLPLYQQKTVLKGTAALFTPIPIPDRFGHCTFTETELATSFGLLVAKVTGQQPLLSQQLKALSLGNNGKLVRSVSITEQADVK